MLSAATVVLVVVSELIAPHAPSGPPPVNSSAPRPPDGAPPALHVAESRRKLTWNDPRWATEELKTALNYTADSLTGNCSNGIQDFGEPDIDCGFATEMQYYYAMAATLQPTQLLLNQFEQQKTKCDGDAPCSLPDTIQGVFCPQFCALGKKCNLSPEGNASLHFPIILNVPKGHDCESGFCEDSFNTGQAHCVSVYKKVPHVVPNGGRFLHPIRVRLLTYRNHTGDRVHYTRVTKMGTDWQGGMNGAPDQSPTIDSPWVPSGGFVLIDEDTILIAAGYSAEDNLLSSTAAVGSYTIARGRYGYGYFVPYYNSAIGFNGMLTRLDLQSPGQAPDFANFQTKLGQGSFDGQLRVLDLTQFDPDLKGFQGGFQALGTTVNQSVTNYAFMVPFFNGRFHGKLTRVNLDYFSLCAVEPREKLSADTKQYFDPEDGTWAADVHPRRHATVPDVKPQTWVADVTLMTGGAYYNDTVSTFARMNNKNFTGGHGWKNNFCGVDVIDLEEIDPSLKGFNGGFEYGGWGYLVPYTNGPKFTSKVVRFNVSSFDPETVEVLDVATALAEQCGGINSPHDTQSRSTTVDPVLCSQSLAGYNGGVIYEGKGYLIPYKHAESVVQGQHTTRGVNSDLPVDKGQFRTLAHGKLTRFDLRTFSNSSVEVLDLTRRDDDLRGYKGGFVHEQWLYLIPYMSRYTGYESSVPSRRNGFNGKLTRVNLDTFDLAGIEWLTLTDIDPDLRGFSNGFNWGNFGFLVPFTNGELNYREKKSFGKVVKVDLTKFTLSAVEVLNLPTMSRQQVPPAPDHGLRGFVDGFAAGDFGYFVPNFNGDFFGKVVRMNLNTNAVQFVDLMQDGAHLSGYSGGFSHTSRRICCDRALGHRKDVCEPLDFDLNKVGCSSCAPLKLTLCTLL
jgi:hypothetical protein